MQTHELTIPEIVLIAGTRVVLGIGIGLLLASKMADGERRGAGRALFAVGVLTTIPLFLAVRSSRTEAAERLAA